MAQTLPDACREHKATELTLVITGANQQLETVELYRASFLLATKEQQPLPVYYQQQQGLSGYEPYPAMPPTWPGLAGLGAPPEAVVLARTMADDMKFHDDHSRLHLEAEGLRQKVKDLEEEIKEQQAIIEARSSITAVMENLKPFLPIATSLLGVDARASKAIAGLAGTEQAETEAPDDPLTTVATGLVREFMGTLHSTHKSQLIWVMQNVREDHNLITGFASFIKQSKTAQQNSPAAQKPEQKRKQEQEQDQGQEKEQGSKAEQKHHVTIQE